MTFWDDQFRDHGISETLSRVKVALDASEKELANAEQIEGHARVKRVVAYCGDALKGVDPELVSRQTLDAISGELANAASSLEQFASAPNQAYLDQANNHLDGLLPHLPALHPPTSTQDIEGLQAAVSTFRRSVGQYTRSIESDVDALGTRTRELGQQLKQHEEKIDAQETRIDNLLSQFQTQFSDEQSQRSTQFNDVLEKTRGQAADLIEEQRSAIEEAMKEAHNEAQATVEETKKTMERELTKLQGEVEKRLEEVNELRAEAERAVGATGSAVLAGGYQKAAKDETRSANTWRVVAALAFLGAAGVAIFAVAHGLSGEFDLERFGAKIAIGLPVIALAYYAAHESSKHREQARINRQLELQLASLDAYMRELPEQERHRLKAELADGFFETGLRAVKAAEERGVRLRRDALEDDGASG